jgi:hypothetical protein
MPTTLTKNGEFKRFQFHARAGLKGSGLFDSIGEGAGEIIAVWTLCCLVVTRHRQTASPGWRTRGTSGPASATTRPAGGCSRSRPTAPASFTYVAGDETSKAESREERNRRRKTRILAGRRNRRRGDLCRPRVVGRSDARRRSGGVPREIALTKMRPEGLYFPRHEHNSDMWTCNRALRTDRGLAPNILRGSEQSKPCVALRQRA